MSKLVVSWSGGKDSCLSSYKLMEEGHEIKYLLTTITEEFKRVNMCGVREELVEKQAEAISIPLYKIETNTDNHTQKWKSSLEELIEKEGIEGLVLGDRIYFEHLDWAFNLCDKVGIKPITPLLNEDPEKILDEILYTGFKPCIVRIWDKYFDNNWLGKIIDKGVVDYFKELGIQIDGQNGEYQTFVLDGPIFNKRILVENSRKLFKIQKKHKPRGYWYLDITKYKSENKY